MALTKCKECKKEVASSAKVCPHCGVKNPGVRGRDMLLGVVLLIAIGFGITKCSSGSDSEKAADVAKAEHDAAACKTDLQCWGDKNIAAASVYCKDDIERLAKYSVKWTDGSFETKMSRFRWSDQSKGIVTYLGDKAQFQNGFGAYQNVIYECDFDPASKAVLDVRVREGRF